MNTPPIFHSDYKELPFKIPNICTYPYYTALLGILSAYDKESIWMYNNFSLIWAMKDIHDIDYWFDFKFGNEHIIEDFCPQIEQHSLSREFIIKTYSTIENAIYTFLNNNFYVMLSVDVYYITPWWLEPDKRRHFRHQLCIFGYDISNNKIIVADFAKYKYQRFEIDLSEFIQGYLHYADYVPYEDFGEEIWLISVKPNYQEKLDINKIIFLTRDFLNSTDTHLINHIQLENKVHKYCFGLNIFDTLTAYFSSAKEENKTFIDSRPLHILVEFYKITKWRLDYLTNLYPHILTDPQTLIKEVDVQIEKTTYIQLLGVKYNIHNNPELLDIIYSELSQLKFKTQSLLLKCLDFYNSILATQSHD